MVVLVPHVWGVLVQEEEVHQLWASLYFQLNIYFKTLLLKSLNALGVFVQEEEVHQPACTFPIFALSFAWPHGHSTKKDDRDDDDCNATAMIIHKTWWKISSTWENRCDR